MIIIIIIIIINSTVVSMPFQNHLGITLDRKLNFDHQLKEKISKANKGIGIIRRLYNIIPRALLITIYKFYIRPHLDYADVNYDQPHKDSFV